MRRADKGGDERAVRRVPASSSGLDLFVLEADGAVAAPLVWAGPALWLGG
jgi:hypothetical protein